MNDTITLSLDSIIDKESPDITEHIKTVGISFFRENGKYLMNFSYSKFMQAISAKSGRKQIVTGKTCEEIVELRKNNTDISLIKMLNLSPATYYRRLKRMYKVPEQLYAKTLF